MLCCGYTLTDFPISIRLTSLALWQSNDCPSASKATLMNMDKYFMWIHYERLHNHNKAKHNKTVCIFLRIYCIRQWTVNLLSVTSSLWDGRNFADNISDCIFAKTYLNGNLFVLVPFKNPHWSRKWLGHSITYIIDGSRHKYICVARPQRVNEMLANVNHYWHNNNNKWSSRE